MNIRTAARDAYSHYIASAKGARRPCSIVAVAVLSLPGQSAQSRTEYSLKKANDYPTKQTFTYATYTAVRCDPENKKNPSLKWLQGGFALCLERLKPLEINGF